MEMKGFEVMVLGKVRALMNTRVGEVQRVGCVCAADSQVALEAEADVARELAAVVWTVAALVKLADGEVLGAQVPVHVDGAEPMLVILLRDRLSAGCVHQAGVAAGDVGAGLLGDLDDAVDVGAALRMWRRAEEGRGVRVW